MMHSLLVSLFAFLPLIVADDTCGGSIFIVRDGEDSQIREDMPNITFGGRFEFSVDLSKAPGNATRSQALIKFDLDTFPEAASSVEEAKIVFYTNDDSNGTVRGYRMIQEWNETAVTWESFGDDGISNDGVEAEVDPSFSLVDLSDETYHDVDVTIDVVFFLLNPTLNQGWGLTIDSIGMYVLELKVCRLD